MEETEKKLEATEQLSEETAQENVENGVAVVETVAEQEQVSAEPEAEQNQKIEIESLRSLIESHFVRLVDFIKFYKNKDANVLALTKELQQYRTGFESNLFKSIALNLIAYREECDATARRFETHKLSKDECVKYLGFMVQEFEDMLQNLGIEVDGDECRYNGKSLNVSVEKVAFRDVPELVVEQIPTENVETTEQLVAYLQKCEEVISKTLQNNSALDVLLADYIAATKQYEKGVYQVVLHPIIKQIVAIYKTLAARVASLSEKVTDDNATRVYTGELATIVERSSNLLGLCGVMIDRYLTETPFDPKQQRVLKLIETDNTELAGTIAAIHTDCYMLDGKVIYPSKVDVYKLKQN